MIQSLECPRCRRRDADAKESGRGRHHCSACGTEFIVVAGPKEAEVRKYLYGHGLLPIGGSNGR
jgi:ribosomal protein L37AE/L43A